MVVIRRQRHHNPILTLRSLVVKEGRTTQNIEGDVAFTLSRACNDVGGFDLTSADIPNLPINKGHIEQVAYQADGAIGRGVTFSWQEYVELGRQKTIRESSYHFYEPVVG